MKTKIPFAVVIVAILVYLVAFVAFADEKEIGTRWFRVPHGIQAQYVNDDLIVGKWVDPDNGNVCYVATGYRETSISCLKP